MRLSWADPAPVRIVGILGMVLDDGPRRVLVGIAPGLTAAVVPGCAMSSLICAAAPADIPMFLLVPQAVLAVALREEQGD